MIKGITRVIRLFLSQCWPVAAISLVFLFSLGCASKVLKVEKSEEVLKNEEFEDRIEIVQLPPPPSANESGRYVRLPGPEPVLEAFTAVGNSVASGAIAGAPASNTAFRNSHKPLVGRKVGQGDTPASQKDAAEQSATQAAQRRQPPLEDSEGFVGRRPLKDPFRVGEKVTLETSYFGVVAGDITLEVKPFAQVNGRTSYQFFGRAVTSSVFAMFYAVDDWFATYVDFETLVPYSYSLHVKESKQLRETRTIFDWSKMKGTYWDKKIDSDKNLEEKKVEWTIPPFSQNVFTTVFYLRNFTLTPGKKISFRVAHEKENLIMTTEVLRREKLKTPAGEFDTIVLKPKIELDGVFRPVGDIFIWMTDDDRKQIVKVESKIKIGKITAIAKSLERGRE